MAAARGLRQRQTEAEKRLWRTLRARQVAGAKFRRQQPVGRYIADFCCLNRRLVVELDGDQHAASTSDAARDAWFETAGFRVLRFGNHDVLHNLQGVLERVREVLGPGRARLER